jgi:membrane-associated phospholipid phosphatase
MSSTVKIGLILFYALLNAGSYFSIKLFVTNDYNFLLPIDSAIPFVPEFIWIYHTLIPVMMLTMYYRHKSKKEFFINFWAVSTASIIISTLYVVLPSFYPYPEFTPDSWSEHVTYWTHKIDAASNTFPSGHVAFSWLMYLGVANSSENTAGKWKYFTWSFLIMVSTLVLKQHYIVDVAAGIVLAYACYYLTKYVMERKHAKNYQGHAVSESRMSAMS